jgi:membrane protein required for beta-lactamase induction
VKLPTILNPDGRRAWAFAAIVGACAVMTAFAFFGVWQVRFIAKYTFYLALAAHMQILVGLTCIGALLVRRTIKAGKDGIEISDSAEAIHDGDSVTVVKE